jgi:hypothetical protein
LFASGSTGCVHARATDNFSPTVQQAGVAVSKQLAVKKGDLLEIVEPPGRHWVNVRRDDDHQGYVPRTLVKLMKHAPVVPGQINSTALLEAHTLGSQLQVQDVQDYRRLREEVKKTVSVIFDDGPFLWDCFKILDGDQDGLLSEAEMRPWICLLYTGSSDATAQEAMLGTNCLAQELLMDDFMGGLIRDRLDRKAPRPVLFNW